MRVRLTDGPDGGVFLEATYRDWEPVREAFKLAIPFGGRSWDATAKKWAIRALYVADLLTFLAQHGAYVQDDRHPVESGSVLPPMPDDLRRAYTALHLAATAPLCVAEASYKALAKYYHPDMGGRAEDFHAVNDAIKTVRWYLDKEEHFDDPIPF
jgi:hypothetical protein